MVNVSWQHSSSSGRRKVTQGKPGVASMASAVGRCSRENSAWLTYAASGNVAVWLKTKKTC